MAKLSMWSDAKNKDYKFVDKMLSSYFRTTGTKVLVHKLIGHYNEDGSINKSKIQDLLFMENRDRHYSPEIFEEYAIYTMNDSDFELSQFGFFNIDTIFIDFHLNEHVEHIGRKIATGDVLELVHLRDDMLEDREGAINAYYVVEDAKRSAEGYDAKWLPHIWRVRVKKMEGSKEYNDILENSEDGIENLMSQYNKLLESNEAIVAEAEKEVPSNDPTNDFEYDYRFDGAIEPPADLDIESLRKVTVFPADATEGEFVIRTDYQPQQVFKRDGKKWVLVNIQTLLRKWTRGHEVEVGFVNNDNTTEVNDETRSERTYITNPVQLPLDD